MKQNNLFIHATAGDSLEIVQPIFLQGYCISFTIKTLKMDK